MERPDIEGIEKQIREAAEIDVHGSMYSFVPTRPFLDLCLYALFLEARLALLEEAAKGMFGREGECAFLDTKAFEELREALAACEKPISTLTLSEEQIAKGKECLARLAEKRKKEEKAPPMRTRAMWDNYFDADAE